MNLLSILLIASLSLISGQDYELICEIKDKDVGVFSSSIRTGPTAGLENADDPTANTYCIIGNFNNDDNLKNAYRGDDGKFGFKLTYTYNDQTTDTLIWRQTSWCADDTIVGAELTDVPSQAGKTESAKFRGLAFSGRDETYLDGTGSEVIIGNNWWYHSVGTTSLEWNNGIPGDRQGVPAYTSSLYVLKPDPCTGVTCAADLVCDAGECVRNCARLDIDGFLTDCSSEFDTNTADIAQLQSDLDVAEGKITANEAAITALGQEDGAINTRIDGLNSRLTTAEGNINDNDADIAGLDGRLTTAEGNINTNAGRLTTAEGNINDNDADIAGLDGRLTAAEGDINDNDADIAGLDGRVGAAESDISTIQGEIEQINIALDQLSAQSPGSNFDANPNDNDYYTDNKSPLIATETKDLLILFLLALNMLTLCIMCTIWMRSRDKYSKYDKVRGYETDENVQLNH